MKSIQFRRFTKTLVPVVWGVFAYAIAIPAFAQGGASPSAGLPQDWSHRHVIYTNPETREEAAAKGTLDEWNKKANDPRFVIQLEKKEQKQKEAAAAKVVENGTGVATGNAIALGATETLQNVNATAKGKKKPLPAPGTEIDRDWSNVMGGSGGLGDARLFPAKWAFGISAKDCVNDFVVFTTNSNAAAGSTTPTDFATKTTGNFTSTTSAGTFTITNGARQLILTAGATNSEKTFADDLSPGQRAINLANAITRNGGVVGVTAVPSGSAVKITAITAGAGGNSIALAETLSNFTTTTPLAGGAGTAGQPTIFALNQLYADPVANGGCETETQPVPAAYWSYFTGYTGPSYTGPTTPAASFGAAPTIKYGSLSAACATLATSTNPGTCDTTVAAGGPVQNLVALFGTALPAGGSVTVTVYINGAATALTCTFTTGTGCSDTTHADYFGVGDKVSVQINRTAGATAWSPTAKFTLTGLSGVQFVADTSPVLYSGQVAFVQSAGTVAELVLLKWSTSSPGTVGAPTTPNGVALANYRTCTAPCMTILPFSGGANDTNSSPYVDYTNDVLYVGDDSGNLHKFTGVFAGTPAEQVGGGFPAVVSAGNVLSSPVFDSSATLVFVGSNCAANTTNCNRLHSVSSGGTVVNSGAIGSASVVASTGGNGVRDAPILDPTAERVYAFIGADNTADGASNPDSLGNSCLGGKQCAAVYQFATDSSLAAQGLGARVIVGASDNSNDLNRAINSGAFDDAYYSSAISTSPDGSLYVCGSQATTQRLFTLWKITIASNTFSARTVGPQINFANGTDVCSPVTVFKNGSSEYLFASVTSGGAAGGGGCTAPASGCMYVYNLTNPSSGTIFDTTSAGSNFNSAANRFMSVSTSVALNLTESSVNTALTVAQSGTYSGMTITQGAVSPASTSFTYTLRKNNATSLAITCTIAAGASTCSDTTNSVLLAAGDLIDVMVARTGAGNLNTTFRVQLGASPVWGAETFASAAINAPGGTGGIIVDNTVANGGSQIYYSTRVNPGNAIQASQAGLQ